MSENTDFNFEYSQDSIAEDYSTETPNDYIEEYSELTIVG